MPAVLRSRAAALAAAFVVLIAGPRLAFAVVADEAKDICPPNADPCQITQTYQVADGAILDFGTRAVEIVGTGKLDAGIGSFTLDCGRFNLATGTSIGLNLKGQGALGTQGGVIVIKSQRRCSNDINVVCLAEIDCALFDAGTCTVGDGTASIGGRILGSADDPAFISIYAAGDVTVTQQIVSNGTALGSDGGSIDIESGGTITVVEKLQVDSGPDGTGGDLCLIAHDDVITQTVIDASGGDFDGGFVEIDAGRDVRISDDVLASANSGEGFGGEITVSAGRDILVVGGGSSNRLALTTDGHESSELFGGDGGTQDYEAGRDIRFSEFVAAHATGAEPDGYGEEISLDAGRDLSLQGDLDSKAQGIYGSGGYMTVYAGRKVTVAATSKTDLTGGDGGGDASIDAGGDIVFAGVIDATTAPDSLPGRADFSSTAGDITFSGDVTIVGEPQNGLSETVTFDACDVHFAAGATILNKPVDGVTDVTGHEAIVVDSGASVSTPDGQNVFTYRAAAPVIKGTVSPAATQTQVPSLVPCPVCGNGEVEQGESCDDGNVTGGDGCSAACVDEGCIAETSGWPNVLLCDDGKSCTVDACNDASNSCDHIVSCSDGGSCTTDVCGLGGDCLHLPHDDLCDDAISCTIDLCSFGGRCRFSPDNTACDDSIECTVDTCDTRVDCRYTPNHTLCADDNPCTADTCVAGEGCTNPPNTALCDDGAACTINDTCSGGVCVGVSDCPDGQVCHVNLGECGEATTTTVVSTTLAPTTSSTLQTPTTLPTTTVTLPPTTSTTVQSLTTTTSPTTSTTVPAATTTSLPPTTTVPAPTTTVPATTTTVPAPTTTVSAPTTTVATPTTTVAPTTTVVPATTTTVPATTTTQPAVTTTAPATTTTGPVVTTTSVTTSTTVEAVCGNGQREGTEQCDGGSTPWTPGQACRDCELLACGDIDDSGTTNAGDALFALRAAVHSVTCSCVCDVDASGSTSAADALRLLRKAVGVNETLSCNCG